MNKLLCVTTNGAAVMVGKKKGIVRLLDNHAERKLLNFYCVIYQEGLCDLISVFGLRDDNCC